jgi:hypothetical protein
MNEEVPVLREIKVKAVVGACVSLAVLLAVPVRAQRPAPVASPEMQRLSNLIVGTFDVVEKHHARPGGAEAEWQATGTATYRPGPDGLSVVEDYRSTGRQGAFSAVAVLWWDPETRAFRHFECESGDPCGVVDDKGAWDGEAIVFTRQMDRQGRRIVLEERYDFSRPDTIVITSRASVDGGPPMTGMTITYTRASRGR